MEPREFHWPISAIYCRMASLLQPAYSEIARKADIPAESRSVLDIGGSSRTVLVYWLGSKDALSLDLVERAV